MARELARVAKDGDTVEIGDWVFEVEAVGQADYPSGVAA